MANCLGRLFLTRTAALKGAAGVGIVSLFVVIGFRVFDGGATESISEGIGDRAILGQIEAEQRLWRNCEGDITLQVSGIVDKELQGREAFLRFRWGRGAFRIEVIDEAGNTMRSIVCDSRNIELGDGATRPFAMLRDSTVSSLGDETLRRQLWPFHVIRQHLFPLTGGPADLMDINSYRYIYRITDVSEAGPHIKVRLEEVPVLRSELVSESEIVYTFDLSGGMKLVGTQMRDREAAFVFVRRWQTVYKAEFGDFVVLGGEGRERVVVPSRHSHSADEDNPGVVTSTVVEGRVTGGGIMQVNDGT